MGVFFCGVQHSVMNRRPSSRRRTPARRAYVPPSSPDRRVSFRREILKKGLDAYFHEDYVVTLHLVIPQIEQALRTLLELGHVSVYKPQQKHGGFILRSLDDLLREPMVKEVFGADFPLYAQVLFTDQRGINLRNDLTHGILSPDRMGPTLADRVFHVLLCLGGVRKKE